MRGLIPFILACLATFSVARAAVDISFPLQGYHKPGRYMPVRVRVQGSDIAYLSIGAGGGVDTQVALASGAADGVAPAMPLREIHRLRCEVLDAAGGRSETPAPPVTWRVVGPDQRIVGVTTADAAFAAGLFPEAKVIAVPLDGADPLPGPAVAWETLDAVLLESTARLEDSTVSTLLGCGVTIAVRGESRPDERWPWQRLGTYWVVRHLPAGPRRTAEDPSAFAAVQGWAADWPAPFRQRIFFLGLVAGIVVLGIALLRPPAAGWIILAVSAAMAGGIGAWWHERSPLLQRGGQITVASPSLVQEDRWRYHATASPTSVAVPFEGVLRPMLELPGDAEYLKLVLVCHGDGEPAGFQYRLLPGLRVGWLSRTVRPAPLTGTPAAGGAAPLEYLARRAYLRPGDQIAGTMAAPALPGPKDAQWWGSLVIRRP